jgi:putative hemolysin
MEDRMLTAGKITDQTSARGVSLFSMKPFRHITPALAMRPLLPGRRVVRDAEGLEDSLGRIGSLEVRLARTVQDIRRAQRLRFNVFYEEMSATPSPRNRLARRDIDPFDRVCDHLLVIDHDFRRHPGGRPRSRVVGTYRLLRQEKAEREAGFYSAAEYDFRGLLEAHPGYRVLELGRSCVLKPYRTKRTVELLWRGIWRYVRHHRIDLMIGCASLEGADPASHARQLSFLHHHARAPEVWRIAALPQRYVPMNRLAKEGIDAKAALSSLPPLIKAYLRIGARFGDGAVVDRQFGTTDVFVALRVEDIDRRYIEFYSDDAPREAH